MSKPDSLHQPPEYIHRLLCAAINSKRLIEFQYKQRRRIAEPHDYGMIEGVKKLPTYQIEGESESGTFRIGGRRRWRRSTGYEY
jgi:hypothetical protein